MPPERPRLLDQGELATEREGGGSRHDRRRARPPRPPGGAGAAVSAARVAVPRRGCGARTRAALAGSCPGRAVAPRWLRARRAARAAARPKQADVVVTMRPEGPSARRGSRAARRWGTAALQRCQRSQAARDLRVGGLSQLGLNRRRSAMAVRGRLLVGRRRWRCRCGGGVCGGCRGGEPVLDAGPPQMRSGPPPLIKGGRLRGDELGK
jgi:hypothetical protein